MKKQLGFATSIIIVLNLAGNFFGIINSAFSQDVKVNNDLIFSIPLGENGIHYEGTDIPDAFIWGPPAFTSAPDGTLYLIRDDVVTQPAITVDETVHYVGTDGVIQGVARVPISEFYYPIMRNAAVNKKGEVFVLLPNEDSLSIVRLNYYQELESLKPGAEPPKIAANSSSP